MSEEDWWSKNKNVNKTYIYFYHKLWNWYDCRNVTEDKSYKMLNLSENIKLMSYFLASVKKLLLKFQSLGCMTYAILSEMRYLFYKLSINGF